MSFADLVVFGEPGPSVAGRRLRAGPLTLDFHEESGSLRHIRLGDREVLRGIYMALRDRNWGTVPPRLSDLTVRAEGDSFRLSFDAACRRSEIDFIWRGEVSGGSDGSVSFRFDGEARTSFLKNRIGFCVLHPLKGCAGEPCEVEDVDGRIERGAFPRSISPHQPFRRIRAIVHGIAPDLRAEVRLEGDTFEMEDHRNWTDASFKTYSTPLELPFPVKVERGERLSQSVRLRLLGSRPAAASGAEAAVHDLRVPSRPTLERPPLGLQVSKLGRPLSAREIERLRILGLSHLRADFRLSRPSWQACLEQAAREARLVGTDLHLALFLSGGAEGELEELGRVFRSSRARAALFLIFHLDEKATGERWVRLAQEKIGRFAPGVPLAAGTDAYFAQLNRSRPRPDSLALPCYSINPQVHAFDSESLVETLEAQPSTVETVREFSSHPAAISPITLRPRFNPDATEASEADPSPGELPPQVDLRQMSLFCAGWTLGSIARLGSTGGVHSLTYYETAGWLGVMEREEGSPLPGKFPSIAGGVFPVFHALADLAGFGRMAPVASSAPHLVEALALFDREGRRRVLVANHSSCERLARLQTSAERARVRLLDGKSAEEALRRPEAFRDLPGEALEAPSGILELALGPCALARIDLEG